MSETLDIAGLTFEVRRSLRWKTLGLTVDRGGELIIHSPENASHPELTKWTRSKLLWVHRKLALKEALSPEVREPEFVSGESFHYLGRNYRLKVIQRQDEPLRFDGQWFYLREDARPRAGEHFQRWYSAVGKKWIGERITLLARKIGASPSRSEVRDLGFRWGSCGKNGVVFFHWRLLQLPVHLIDYVIAHELGHLLEPRHSPEFWRILDRALPDWRERKEELKTTAKRLSWRRTPVIQ